MIRFLKNSLFIILVLVFATACKQNKNNQNSIKTIKAKQVSTGKISPLVIAHRGASEKATENTLSAIKKAIEMKSDGVEVDIWRTTDDSLVVFHDAHTKRLAGDSLSLPKSSYAELRNLKLPNDEYIPTIREVLQLLPDDMKIFIEWKNNWEKGKAGDVFPELAEILEQTGTKEQAAIIAFNLEKAKDSKKYLPDNPFYWLIYKEEPADTIVQKALDAGIEGVNVSFYLANKRLKNLTKEKGLGFYVWTVNEPEIAQKVISLNPDGITTNEPDMILRMIDSIR